MDLKELTQRRNEAKEMAKELRRMRREAALNSESTYVNKEDKKIERTLNENTKEKGGVSLDNWRPCELHDVPVPEFNIPVKSSNNYEVYKREQLSKILTFIDFVKRKRLKSGCTAMPIPTTSRLNLMIWGHPMAITRAIEFMKEIGLIKTFVNEYRFNAPFKGENYGKIYAYFKENEEKVIEYCKDNNIHKYIIKNVEEIETKEQMEALEDIKNRINFDISSVRFGKGLKLEKPEGFSVSEFKVFLTQCLYCNYPEFKFYQTKADEINKNFYEEYPEFKIRFKPHFTWKGKTVVKIGIRAANEYCCKEKEERKLLLDQYGFNLKKDVRSSVPRITLSINKGHWIDEDIDIYKLINDEFAPDVEFTEEYRDILKEYVLPTYFEEGSDKMIGKNATYKFRLSKREKKEVDAMLGRLRRALVKAVGGKTFGSEIFYIESCIYIMTLYDLLTSRHMVWLVYDAFYSNGEEDQETYETMLREGIKINFKNFYEQSIFYNFSEESNVGKENFKKGKSIKEITKAVAEKYKIKIVGDI